MIAGWKLSRRLRHFQFPQEAGRILAGLLPRNPRKVKQFIRRLQRLQGTLSRFGEDEWSPGLVLLCELLRSTSAEIAEALLNDRAFFDGLVVGNFMVRPGERHDESGLTKVQFERIDRAARHALPRDDSSRQVLVKEIAAIVAAAAENVGLLAPDAAWKQSRLDQQPPVMTLREFDVLFRSWRSDPSAARMMDLMVEHARSVESPREAVLQACLESLLTRRGQFIDEAAEAPLASEVDHRLSEARELFRLLEQLVSDCGALSEPVSGRVELFLKIRTQTAQFVNRINEPEYAEERKRHREVLYAYAHVLRDRAADVLKELKPWEQGPPMENVVGAQELSEAREELRMIVGGFVADEVLERFRRAGGIAGVGNFMTHPAETWTLLHSSSPLHRPDRRGHLKAIAEESEQGVAQNFFVYLRMLSGTEGGGFTASSLAKDPDLVVPAWRAAAKVHLQPKMKWMLVELAERLRAGLPDPSLIVLPPDAATDPAALE